MKVIYVDSVQNGPEEFRDCKHEIHDSGSLTIIQRADNVRGNSAMEIQVYAPGFWRGLTIEEE